MNTAPSRGSSTPVLTRVKRTCWPTGSGARPRSLWNPRLMARLIDSAEAQEVQGDLPPREHPRVQGVQVRRQAGQVRVAEQDVRVQLADVRLVGRAELRGVLVGRHQLRDEVGVAGSGRELVHEELEAGVVGGAIEVLQVGVLNEEAEELARVDEVAGHLVAVGEAAAEAQSGERPTRPRPRRGRGPWCTSSARSRPTRRPQEAGACRR